MDLNKRLMGAVLVAFLACATGRVLAVQEELQFGYVFDGWESNSIYHGYDQRIPLAYYFSVPNLSLSLNTAFVSGDYIQDAVSGNTGSEFKASEFSDTNLGANWILDMGNSVKCNLTGSLNFPTGDTSWEIQQEPGSIPYVFEPTYYHGRGWGGNIFYTLSASNSNAEYGVGAGYMATSTYDTGLSSEGLFNPGDTVAVLGTAGFRMSGADVWAFRFVRTFPLEATYPNPAANFTFGQGSIATSQWISQMGKDKLVINFSYSFYNSGFTADTNPPNELLQDPGPYFGDRLEVHPIMGYGVGNGTVMETGLVWDRILPNGYALSPGDSNYEGGGNLLGAEQSITFQLDSATFLNFAGLYHYIENDNFNGVAGQTITYQRFTLGTNAGFKW